MSFADKIRKRRFDVSEEGLPFMVLRPKDPDLAVRLSNVALGIDIDKGELTPCSSKTWEERQRDFDAVLGAQDYQFVGWRGSYRKNGLFTILDKDGRLVETCQRGDSLICNPFCVPTCFANDNKIMKQRALFPEAAFAFKRVEVS